jgi:hypothetical protein
MTDEAKGDTKIGMPGDDGETTHRTMRQDEVDAKGEAERERARKEIGENRPETDNRND